MFRKAADRAPPAVRGLYCCNPRLDPDWRLLIALDEK
jgi:hypothetical protein